MREKVRQITYIEWERKRERRIHRIEQEEGEKYKEERKERKLHGMRQEEKERIKYLEYEEKREDNYIQLKRK